jgi:aldehyde:ferredoxin oxidoreductase
MAIKLLRVDMRNENIVATDFPKEWLTIGGSGLIAKIMNDEVPPETDPLCPDNKLIIACGPLAGTSWGQVYAYLFIINKKR